MPNDIPAGAIIALLGSEADIAAVVPRIQAAGSTALIAPASSPLLNQLADEVWVLADGDVKERGHASAVLQSLNPTMRRGDGRAEVLGIETLDANDQPTRTFASGHAAAIRIRVRFSAEVATPVIGIMIRTRIGMEVYGTNTELEQVQVGPCAPGDERTLTFRFQCDLCPGFYTLTAASHDPDGVWHDWLEDAISFNVSDTRYTAGVANLRAKVEVR